MRVCVSGCSDRWGRLARARADDRPRVRERRDRHRGDDDPWRGSCLRAAANHIETCRNHQRDSDHVRQAVARAIGRIHHVNGEDELQNREEGDGNERPLWLTREHIKAKQRDERERKRDPLRSPRMGYESREDHARRRCAARHRRVVRDHIARLPGLPQHQLAPTARCIQQWSEPGDRQNRETDKARENFSNVTRPEQQHQKDRQHGDNKLRARADRG